MVVESQPIEEPAVLIYRPIGWKLVIRAGLIPGWVVDVLAHVLRPI